MKAVLEFVLPEEREEYEMATDGVKYYIVLFELLGWLRQQWKYDAGEVDADTAELIRDKIVALCDDEEVAVP